MSQRSSDLDARFGRAWREHRRYVLDIGFRMLGNVAEAEDVVQEAFARLLQTDIDDLDDVRGWLVVVVRRLCLDRLRSEVRHPMSFQPPPEGGGGVDPADRITLDENVQLALHEVLTRLSPAERTALVLHDIFRYSFEEVGEIVGRSAAACRQLASRARAHIRSDSETSRFTVEPVEQHRVTERFVAACSRGDLAGLLSVLDPNVEGVVDLGPGRPRPPVVVGADDVAANSLRFFGPDTEATLLSLSDELDAVIALSDEVLGALITFTTEAGRIVHIDAVVDPVQLAPLAEALGARTFPEVVPPNAW
jgi:RNA polymerase sigma-70 factor (ECF subfamily)